MLAPLKCEAASGFWDIHGRGSVSSTNDLVKEALRAGCDEGYCICALQQTGGYGRQGRAWISPVGGLYTSFALRPARDVQELSTLSLVVSLACFRAIKQHAAQEGLKVKWPNDVLCDAGKLCGISLEAVYGGVCVGIGINAFRPVVAQAVSGKYRAAHLFDEAAHDGLSDEQRQQLTSLFSTLLQEVRESYRQWSQEGFAAFQAEYESCLAYRGRQVQLAFIDGSPLFSGTMTGIDAQGRLLVQGDTAVRALSFGEVHLLT